MNMKKRIFAVFTSAALLVSGLVFSTAAVEVEGMTTLIEESFDDYSNGYAGSQTGLASVFTINADSIGNSSIKVLERDDGNLTLQSKVFTECYITTPLSDGYVFGLDIFQAQGTEEHGVFFRAQKPESANFFTELDSDISAATHNVSGISFHILNNDQGSFLRVCIKSFDATAHNNATVTRVDIPMPGNSFTGGQSIKIVDDNTKADIYIDSTKMCTINMSNPGTIYSSAIITEACFSTVSLTRADNGDTTTVNNSLVTSDHSVFGWTTRVCEMTVDDVYVLVPTAGGSVVPPSDATEETNPPIVDLPGNEDTGSNETTPLPSDDTTPDTTPVTTPDTTPNTADTDPTEETTGEQGPANDDDSSSKPASRGCGGVVGMSALGILMTSAAAAVVLKKRK